MAVSFKLQFFTLSCMSCLLVFAQVGTAFKGSNCFSDTNVTDSITLLSEGIIYSLCNISDENCFGLAMERALSTNNSVLRIPAGRWKLKRPIIASSFQNVSITGSCNGTVVECNGSSGLAILNAQQLTLSYLFFESCGICNSSLLEIAEQVERYVNFDGHRFTADIPVSVLIAYSRGLEMSNVTFSGGRSIAFMLMNPFEDTVLTNLTFFNITRGLSSRQCAELGEDVGLCTAGSMIMYYGHDGPNIAETMTRARVRIDNLSVRNVVTIHSVIKNDMIRSVLSRTLRVSLEGPNEWALSAGFSLVVDRTDGPEPSITMNKAIFQNNRSPLAGCLYAAFSDAVVSTNFVIHDSTFTVCEGGAAGGALYMSFGFSSDTVTAMENHVDGNVSVIISNSTFKNCVAAWGAGIALVGSVDFHFETLTEYPPAIVHVNGNSFFHNSAFAGSAVALWNSKFHGSQRSFGVEIHFTDNFFSGNMRQLEEITFSQSSSSDTTLTSGVVYVESGLVYVSPSSTVQFEMNFVTSVVLVRSVLVSDRGRIIIRDNLALEGGGFEIRGESFFLDRNATTYFIRNQALVRGGAVSQIISSASPLRAVIPNCFMHFGNFELFPYNLSRRVEEGLIESEINVTANIAGVTGSDLFISVPNDCPWFPSDTGIFQQDGEVRQGLFPTFTSGNAKLPPISSAPGVGIGLGRINVFTNPPSSLMPGEEFIIALNVTDSLNIRSSSVLGVGFNNSDRFSGVHHTINDDVLAHIDGRNTTVRVRIFGHPNNTISFILFSMESFTFSETLTTYLIDCQIGFKLSSGGDTCICDPALLITSTASTVDCNENGTISVSSGIWVGLVDSQFVTHRCIFDFCIPGSVTIQSLNNETEQCANDRSGTLCGKCRKGYSTVFGSNKCFECSTYFLFTIFGFALAGLLLIAFLMCTRVSFTSGILGGAVFYANIISVFAQQIFPASFNANTNPAYILVSFITLNLGFELCFYNGMDRLAVAALQLVFPAYLIGIVLTVIGLARCFPKMPLPRSNILVEVLATVVLISYTAVLEAVTQILGVVVVGGQVALWLQDPTVRYGQGLHLFYMILSVAVIMVFILPVPMVIIFPNLFSRFKFYTKLHPYIYSIQVPFKNTWRRWEGIRILFRTVLLILATLSYVLSQDGLSTFLYSALFMILVLTFQAYIEPYEKSWLNILDLFYLVNLLFVLLISLVLRSRTDILLSLGEDSDGIIRVRTAVITSLMASALLVFAVTIVLHLAVKFHWKDKMKPVAMRVRACNCCKWMNLNSLKFRRHAAHSHMNMSSDTDDASDTAGSLNARPIQVPPSETQWNYDEDQDVQINKVDMTQLRESLLGVEMTTTL